MTWVRLSDQTARDETLRSAGKDAALLWVAALIECAAVDEGAGADGRLSPMRVKDAAHLFDLNARKASARLVERGLWHDVETVASCDDCLAHGGDRLHPAELFIHGWWDRLLSSAGKRDGVVRDHELRRKRLDRKPSLKAMIRRRDRDLCRYCGVLTTWGADHKSAHSGTFDHVDPFAGNNPENVVVACRRCNGRKRDRTPEQAGMALLPEPTYQATIQPDQATDPTRGADSRADLLAGAHETGPGRVGLDIGAGSGLGPVLVDADLALVSNGNGNGHGPSTNGDHG